MSGGNGYKPTRTIGGRAAAAARAERRSLLLAVSSWRQIYTIQTQQVAALSKSRALPRAKTLCGCLLCAPPMRASGQTLGEHMAPIDNKELGWGIHASQAIVAEQISPPFPLSVIQLRDGRRKERALLLLLLQRERKRERGRWTNCANNGAAHYQLLKPGRRGTASDWWDQNGVLLSGCRLGAGGLALVAWRLVLGAGRWPLGVCRAKGPRLRSLPFGRHLCL